MVSEKHLCLWALDKYALQRRHVLQVAVIYRRKQNTSEVRLARLDIHIDNIARKSLLNPEA